MIKYILLFIIVISCTKKIYIPIETIITTKEIIKDTIIHIKIEKEYIQNITSDTVSYVETKFAFSNANYNASKGLLYHNIINKDSIIPIEIRYISREIIKEIPSPYPVEIEKKVEVYKRLHFRWWENLFFYMGIASIIFFAFLIVRKIK